MLIVFRVVKCNAFYDFCFNITQRSPGNELLLLLSERCRICRNDTVHNVACRKHVKNHLFTLGADAAIILKENCLMSTISFPCGSFIKFSRKMNSHGRVTRLLLGRRYKGRIVLLLFCSVLTNVMTT